MHIKFLKHGQGSCRKAADYLLGTHDHLGIERTAVVQLRGDINAVAILADSLDFRHRYTSGVIAFSPTDAPTDEQINRVLDDFDRVAFAGLSAERVMRSAILHREESGGCHIHYVAARVDLKTGKSFTIAPMGWQSFFDPLRNYYNHAMGWSRPDDPNRARLIQPRDAILGLKQRIAEDSPADAKIVITKYLTGLVERGVIENRDDVVRALVDADFEITRLGDHYLSIRDESTGKTYRLKGPVVEKDFLATTWTERPAPVDEIDHPRAEQARLVMERGIEVRSRYSAVRYRVPEPSPQPPQPPPRIDNENPAYRFRPPTHFTKMPSLFKCRCIFNKRGADQSLLRVDSHAQLRLIRGGGDSGLQRVSTTRPSNHTNGGQINDGDGEIINQHVADANRAKSERDDALQHVSDAFKRFGEQIGRFNEIVSGIGAVIKEFIAKMIAVPPTPPTPPVDLDAVKRTEAEKERRLQAIHAIDLVTSYAGEYGEPYIVYGYRKLAKQNLSQGVDVAVLDRAWGIDAVLAGGLDIEDVERVIRNHSPWASDPRTADAYVMGVLAEIRLDTDVRAVLVKAEQMR